MTIQKALTQHDIAAYKSAYLLFFPEHGQFDSFETVVLPAGDKVRFIVHYDGDDLAKKGQVINVFDINRAALDETLFSDHDFEAESEADNLCDWMALVEEMQGFSFTERQYDAVYKSALGLSA